ncbi:MAG: hypothetical protein ACFB4I_06730 [Cyanophyceae cyanobacterium]
MSYQKGDRVRITTGILRGQVGEIADCRFNLYFVRAEYTREADLIHSYGPFLNEDIELLQKA